MKQDITTKAFENRGHYLLKCETNDGKKVIIDRHTRKSDLLKMSQLLDQY